MKVGDIISREKALEISPAYVNMAERDDDWYDFIETVVEAHNVLKKGDIVMTYVTRSPIGSQFIVAKVSNIKPMMSCPEAEDGPIIMVTDGDKSWLVTGDTYCVPIPQKEK